MFEGERAQKLYDFYEPIARLKTEDKESMPVESDQPAEKNLEDQLMGG